MLCACAEWSGKIVVVVGGRVGGVIVPLLLLLDVVVEVVVFSCLPLGWEVRIYARVASTMPCSVYSWEKKRDVHALKQARHRG